MPLDGTWSFHPYLAARVRSFDLEAAASGPRRDHGAVRRAMGAALRMLGALALLVR